MQLGNRNPTMPLLKLDTTQIYFLAFEAIQHLFPRAVPLHSCLAISSTFLSIGMEAP